MSLVLSQLVKSFRNGPQCIRVLESITIELHPGDFGVVYGPSGSGKSTLLLTMGGMLRPTAGAVIYDGRSLYAMGSSRLKQFRKRHVGFVFQRFHLLEYLNLFQNIRLALAIQGKHKTHAPVHRIAEEFGLTDRLSHHPSQLSIGERQRAAIARALVGEPSIVLADEPTGNLDIENGETIAKHLRDYAAKGNIVIMVTHSPGLFKAGNRCIAMRSGTLEETSPDIVSHEVTSTGV